MLERFFGHTVWCLQTYFVDSIICLFGEKEFTQNKEHKKINAWNLTGGSIMVQSH